MADGTSIIGGGEHSDDSEVATIDPTIKVITTDELKARAANNEPDQGDPGNDNGVQPNLEQVPRKKRKSKRKPASKRGLNAPTGFEEYHADAPLTPAEHAKERELYDPSLLFTERILKAIHRFERHRKMSPEMLDIFYKYLKYGGVTIGPNMFQGGISKTDMEGMDKEQIDEAMAQTSISPEKDDVGTDTSAWAVDFEGVMKGFLSRRAPYYYGFEVRSQVETVTKVLSNFMNYLLHHDVCPEYAADILAARNLCKTATAELWACAEAQRWLPGDFNIACSTLFDGAYAHLYNGVTSWMPEDSGVQGFVGMTEDIAGEVVKFAIAGAGSEELYQKWSGMANANIPMRVVEVHKAVGFEIIAIEQVDPETKVFYKEHSADYRPVGKIRAKPWTNPDGPPEDLTKEERELLKRPKENAKTGDGSGEEVEGATNMYEFFIEEVVLQHLFVGMKMEATVRRVNCGIWFFDEMLRAFCSFDTYLCNELMLGWKEPRRVEVGMAELEENVDMEEIA